MHRLTAILLAVYLAATSHAAEPAGMYAALKARSIGPANMSGRICDIAVDEHRPSTIYVATASGGLWKTVNNGGTWASVLDDNGVWSVGAVAVSPADPKVVWAGSGEANPRNSVSWGNGVYRTTNGGATWENVGLRDTMHIGRIAPHPARPDVAYVAALGHVWGQNVERGLFKTEDGGKTWIHALKIDADTGCIDVALDPRDPETVFAAAWQVRRGLFSGGNPAVHCGPGSGLYRSTDGGRTWLRLTNGLPTRAMGRIGIAVDRNDPKRVFAVIATDKTPANTVGGAAKTNSSDIDVGGVFHSDDSGNTWVKLNDLCPRPFYYGQVRLDPSDRNRIYILGVQFFASDDGGKTFREGAPGTHADHHALWIDPRNPDHLIEGNDGGINFSYDRGKTWEHLLNLPISQFYGVAVDSGRPYLIYGGLQDNGTWRGPSRTTDAGGVTVGDWGKLLGADGFRCATDPTDPNTVYCESQYGRLSRYDASTGRLKEIQPRAAGNAPAYRFNWNSPVVISAHAPKAVYFGGNHVFRSVDRGDTWLAISPDLTAGMPGPAADSGHTLTAIAESPITAGRLYTGTDDGKLWTTPDDGKSWLDLTDRLPISPNGWINSVECSHVAPAVVYVAVSRHRHDDRTPLMLRSEDFGASWRPASNGLPPGAVVHVVRESSRKSNLLFAGTEIGLFMSQDAGTSWSPLKAGIPPVPIHDLTIHPRERELVIGTHGRGIYILDVAVLEELTPTIVAEPAYLFSVKSASISTLRPSSGLRGNRFFSGENPTAGAHLWVYLSDTAGPPKLTISDASGKVVATLPVDARPGLQRIVWNLRRVGSTTSVLPGEYRAMLVVGNRVQEQKIQVNGRAVATDSTLEPDVP
ncbi:MAG: hypothetical protein U0746_02435 [Gemmataceae bacterium]